MTAETLSSPQVMIVGGGPVGLGLAIDLGQRGVRCVLIEKYESPQPIPRGQNLTQRTLEHFHFWGAEPALRAARTIPREYGIGGMTAYGTLLSDYRYDWLQRELVRPFYFMDNERLPQYATEAVLRQRLSELPSVETLYGWTAETVAQDGNGVEVSLRARGSSETRRLRAEYAVGCDGSRSLVRDACGITQTKSDHDRLMVLLVFRSEGLHKLLERYPNKSFYNVLHPDLKGYWRFFGRVDLGTTWFFHAPVPMGTTKDNFDFRALVHEAVGTDFDIDFEHVGFWELRVATADRYRSGRVFVAGDAAHSHPPYGGYGINTGLEDAANLGWKLAAVLQGWAGPALLDTYDSERRPVFVSTARDFIEKAIESDRDFLAAYDPSINKLAFESEWQARASGARSEVHSFEPNYEGSPIVTGANGGAPSAIGAHEFVARAGHHLAPYRMASGRDVYDELGADFTLIDLGAPPETVAEFNSAAEAHRVPLKVVTDKSDAAQKHYEARLILVRPDQFVAFSAKDALSDPRRVLQRVIGDTG